MDKMFKYITSLFLLCYLSILNADVSIMPNVIYFDNETDISFEVKISGMPGKPIPAQKINHAIPYMAVITASEYKKTTNACELNFFDKSNGQKVASAVINVYQASIISPPIFYGEYAGKYLVSGWDSTPISRIRISKN